MAADTSPLLVPRWEGKLVPTHSVVATRHEDVSFASSDIDIGMSAGNPTKQTNTANKEVGFPIASRIQISGRRTRGLQLAIHKRYTAISSIGILCLLLGGCFSDDIAPPIADAGPPIDASNPCPEDMVFVSEFNVCIDRYEASQLNGRATSRAMALPWHSVTFVGASVACQEVGKRLCSGEEWVGACSGPPPAKIYPYGDIYDPDACGGLETTLPAGLHQSGSLLGCEGGYPGIFDMSANVWEWSTSCDDTSCLIRGGGELEGEVGSRCNSSRAIPKDDLGASNVIGFRCCMSAPPTSE